MPGEPATTSTRARDNSSCTAVDVWLAPAALPGQRDTQDERVRQSQRRVEDPNEGIDAGLVAAVAVQQLV
jgi:hypothetical protein